MNTVFFRNTAALKGICAVCMNTDESVIERIVLKSTDVEGDFCLDFDNARFDHLYFESEDGVKTGVAYPGTLSIGVEYKFNEDMGKELTYLFAKGIEKTGSVHSFVIRDEKNLAHRKDMSKKISVFLPEGYDGTTLYDILYFFDAQNLFGLAGEYTDCGDPYGGWQLDVALAEISRQRGKNVIVVGIDNADEYRSQELFMNPADFGELSPLATAIPEDDFSRGYLDGLSSFMVGTLHPFIKERYCVSEKNIGIGGSSMGGIAAFYCGLRERGFYRYVLSYSPAFGLYEMSAFENYFKKVDFHSNEGDLPKIHIYCGEGDMLERMLLSSARQIKSTLLGYGYPEKKVFETYDVEKAHNEESWRLVLPQSLDILI